MMAEKENKMLVGEEILTFPNDLFLNSGAASWLKMDIGDGRWYAGSSWFQFLLWAL